MKKAILPTIAVLLIVVGLVGRYGPQLGWSIPGAKNPVTAAVIFYETKTLQSQPVGVRQVIEVTAGKHGVRAFDFQVKGPGGKEKPVALVPFLAACEGDKDPQLITRRGTNAYATQPCPDSEPRLVEAIK